MKKILFLVIICILIIFYSSIAYADSTDRTRDKIDAQVIKIIKIIGYMIILIFGIKEVIQKAQNGDIQSVVSTFVRYLIIYGVLLGLPVGLKWVEVFIEELK